MALMTDGVTSIVELALNGVAQRQRVTSNNIANVATPRFRASRVAFEKNLAEALRTGNLDRADATAPAVVAANTPARIDGNNVALEEETAILVRSGLQFDALVAALNHKFAMLRTAING